jgi:hypothetical protein
LSERACQGILNRANRRGKKLPEQLEQALIRQATPLKSGGGVERDSYGKKAGKGPLVQTELSGTLGVSQDQTLITHKKQIEEWVDAVNKSAKHQQNLIQSDLGVARTLACGTHASGPHLTKTLVTGKVYGISSYDSNAMKSSNPHSGIYEADTSRTLDLNGGSQACNQGGMIVLEGNGSRESHRGDGYKESETMYSLNTVEQHAICVGNGQLHNAAMKPIANSLDTMHDQQAILVYDKETPVTSIDEKMGQTYIGEEVGNTLSARDYKQPQAVVYGVDCYNQTQTEEVSKALNSAATDSDHVPCVYGLDRASFNQGKNALYDFSVEEEKAQTLVSRGPGGGDDQTVGALCARDYKGVGNQYVNEGKVVIQKVSPSAKC